MEALLDAYAEALLAHVAVPEEAGRSRAYDLGRLAMTRGLGVLDVIRLHTRALDRHPALEFAAGPPWEFLLEALAPLEMAFRGFRDANQSLREAAQHLEDRVLERTAELRAVEQALRDQGVLLRSVIDGMTDAVGVSDLDGRFVLYNPAAEELFQVARWLDASGDWPPGYETYLPDEETHVEPRLRPLARALSGGQVNAEELFVRPRAGGPGLHVSVSAAPLRDAGGAVTGAVMVVRDISARRRAEATARAVEERLTHAERMDAIGQLAGGVAHDFNNLLAVISSYAGLLADDLAPSDPRLGDVRQIENASRSAASLTRQLLAFSRRQVLLATPMDLNEVVAEMLKMLKRTLGEQIQVHCALSADPVPVVADRGQLEQILLNLALNARDAMPRGGELTLETHSPQPTPGEAEEGRLVSVCVRDTGVGMDEATLSRIFEPFFTTKALGRGTGLGLATVYGIVEQSGGKIEVTSEPGRGSTFTVRLPRAGHLAAPPVARERGLDDGDETILLVEDERAVRAVAARVLRASGYLVLEAEHGEAALRVAARHTGKIHLLLTDVVMPGLTGPELARAVASKRPGIRVLFASGYAPEGVDGAIIEKPFTPESLRQKVREVLR